MHEVHGSAVEFLLAERSHWSARGGRFFYVGAGRNAKNVKNYFGIGAVAVFRLDHVRREGGARVPYGFENVMKRYGKERWVVGQSH